MTICQNLIILYRSAVSNEKFGEAQIIEDCYIMAKKMNRKLVEYSGSQEICGTEEGWHEELRKVVK